MPSAPKTSHAQLLISALCVAAILLTAIIATRMRGPESPEFPQSGPADRHTEATHHNVSGSGTSTQPTPTAIRTAAERARRGFRTTGDAAVALAGSYVVRAQDGVISLRLGRAIVPVRSTPATSRSDSSSALSIATRRIQRDGESLLAANRKQSVVADGALVIAGPEVIEHWVNHEIGTEQSWRFERRPRGSGDLSIAIEVQGVDLVRADHNGLLLADSSGTRWRYGHATWLDAHGEKTAVPATFDRGMIRLDVPASLVDASAYPAVLDPVLGPEQDVGEPWQVPGPRGDRSPSVAYGDGVYVAVWESEGSIFAVRINDAGQVLDSLPVNVISSFSGGRPVVGFDGQNFLVTWLTGTSNGRTNINGVRIASNLSVVGSHIRVGSNAGATVSSMYIAAVTALDGGSLVTWVDASMPWRQILASRVTYEGVVLDSPGITVSPAAPGLGSVTVAAQGTTALVVWQQDSPENVYGTRIDFVSGTKLESQPFGIATGAYSESDPSVASNGSEFLVTWSDSRSTPLRTLCGARVDVNGTVLNPGGTQISSTSAYRSAIAQDGDGYLATWALLPENTMVARHLDAAGTPVGPEISIPAGGQFRRIAAGGSGHLVIWEAYRNGSNEDVVGVLIGDADAGEPFLVSTQWNAQNALEIASDGTGYLALWWGGSSSPNQAALYGVLLNESGETLGGAPIVITEADSYYGLDVVFDGTDYVAAWAQWTRNSATGWDIHAARIRRNGAVLESNAFPVRATTATEYRPRADSNGHGQVLVAWHESESQPELRNEVRAARLMSDGSSLDTTPILVATNASNPDVASDGEDYLIAWTKDESSARLIESARVTASGAVLDPNGIAIARTDQYAAPLVAYGAGRYLATWTERRGAYPYTYVLTGIRISQDGTVLDAAGFEVTHASRLLNPVVAFDGASFVVVGGGDGGWYAGVRVSVQGAVLDEQPWDLTSGTTPYASGASIASGPNGSVLIGYTDDRGGLLNISRAFSRTYCRESEDATCDGLDDDCSGQVDEDFVATVTTCGVGVCEARGTTACVAGAITDSCIPAPQTSLLDTTCDGLDNDCSGEVDEDFESTTTTCGTGVCATHGILRCEGGVVVDTCMPAMSRSAIDDTCDNVDDDCSGEADEDGECMTTLPDFDAGVDALDAGVLEGDAGAESDASLDDASTDASFADSNVIPDATAPDTGTLQDAGAMRDATTDDARDAAAGGDASDAASSGHADAAPDAGPPRHESGCACHVVSSRLQQRSTLPMMFCFVLGFFALHRVRRRARSHTWT